MDKILSHEYSKKILLDAPAKDVFAFLDDPKKLSAHMGKSSMMMAGSKMTLVLDEKQGREVGSVIKMRGKMLGFSLSLQEKIIERVQSQKKTWETFGLQHLLILDQYRMGFSLSEAKLKTELTVWIKYTLPPKGITHLLGRFLAAYYAKWCINQMISDAQKKFRAEYPT